jgi:regulator of sigma E protease
MQVLSTILYFIITIGILVLVHELGHFLAAKFFKMRVDRFSIGFPPRAFGKQIGETDYCVSWLPIGGYVKIAGMIDESFDTEFLDKPPEPWEYRAKPIWQRMIVISAGVIMNFLLAMLIFSALNFSRGTIVRETTTIGVVVDKSPAAQAGLAVGDRITAVNGTPVADWDAMIEKVYLSSMSEDVNFTLERAGSTIHAVLPRSLVGDPTQTPLGVVPDHTDIVIGTVEVGKPADKLGLKPNDVLLTLNGNPVRYDQQVREVVKAHAGKDLEIEWKRGDEVLRGSTVPTTDGRIGISFMTRFNGPVKHIRYGLIQSLGRGVSDLGTFTGLFVQQIWQIIVGKVAFSQSVGGPIKIAQMASQSAESGITSYLGFMAMLSISLAALNILPLPALDGGHLFFLIWEAIFRKEIPAKVKLAVQRAGMFLLLAFMAFVLYNDIVHF